MAQSKLTDKTAFGDTLNAFDLIHIVDVSDTAQDPAGSSYKLTLGQLLPFVQNNLTFDNIYNNDGTLTANRTVNLNGNELIFTDAAIIPTFKIRSTNAAATLKFQLLTNTTNTGGINVSTTPPLMTVYSATGHELQLSAGTGANINLLTNATARLTVLSGGNVGIGDTSFAGAGTYATFANVFIGTNGSTRGGIVINNNSASSYTGEKIGIEVGSATWHYGFSSALNALTFLTTGSSSGNWLFGYGTSSSPTIKMMYNSTYGGFGVNVGSSVNAVGHFKMPSVGVSTDAILRAETFGGITNFIVQNNGNVGINGVTSPTSNLHVKTSALDSGFRVDTSTNDLIFKIDDNFSVYSHGKGSIATNTAYGLNALIANTTGFFNTAFGVESLNQNTIGAINTAFGYRALQNNTSGNENTAIGYHSLKTNTTGGYNTGVGLWSLESNTTGFRNVAIGHASMRFNTTGAYSTAIGERSLLNNTTGNYNTAIGVGALRDNTTGSTNTAVGEGVFQVATNSTGNVGLGYYAGSAETGSNKLFIDNQSRVSEANARVTSLIYGIFNASVANQELHINAQIINVDDLPTVAGAAGTLWVDAGAGNVLKRA